MNLDINILWDVLEGLNKLEGKKVKSFTLKGLSLVESGRIKGDLFNYNVLRSQERDRTYNLIISKYNQNGKATKS